MKKILIIILFVFMLASTFGSVFASAPNVSSESMLMQLRYAIINTISSGLTIDSGGKATCSTKLVSGSSGSDCYITMELQQKSNNKWSTLKTWTTSKMNGTSVSIEKDYYIVEGTYRVKVTGTIENSELDIKETAVKYSKEVVY